MTLMTPIPRDLDMAFPGENWFFYWRTSASLWKTKLQEFPGNKIILPLNWSFHSETGDHFDFGETRPETDLKKLIEMANDVGKNVVFFLPVTPAPYLPNGGLPHLLARTLSLNADHMAYGLIDADDNLIKLYSFYDPRVFEAFDRFVKKLGHYFSSHRISADLWGVRAGHFQHGQFKSYLEDYSKVFDQAYSRFLATKKTEEQTLSILENKQFTFEFVKNIQELYVTNAKESIGVNFEGVLDVAFLGGSTENFLKRLYGSISLSDYTREIYEALAHDVIPSSVLINSSMKKGILGRELTDLVANSYLPSRLSSTYEHEDIAVFTPLSFFKVYEKVDGLSSAFQSYEDLKLWDYLKEHFGFSYKIISRDQIKNHDMKNPYQENILMFHGHDLDRNLFNHILSSFMNGGKIILNSSGLSTDFSKRLEIFLMENSLPVEKVFMKTSIQNLALGEGRLILFDGEGLLTATDEDLQEFWEKIIHTFSLIHVQIQNPEGIDYFWRTRSSTTNELKFEEVRRLSLYNPTSYRKKVKVNLNKNFVIYKVLDEINSLVQTFPSEVQVELMPEGSVILDFGVFS